MKINNGFVTFAVVVLGLIVSVQSLLQQNEKEQVQKMYINSFIQFTNEHEKTEITSDLQNMMELRNQDKSKNPLKCQTCRVAVNKLRSWAQGYDELLQYISQMVINLCSNKLNLFNLDDCQGVVDEQAPIWFGSAWTRYVDADFVCPELDYCEPVYEKINLDDHIADILKDKPVREQLVPKQENTVKYLHLADLHTDFMYTVGVDSQCHDYTCCRPNSGEPSSEDARSGYWGTVGVCDIPTRTFEKAVQYLKNHLKDVEFALWTGDNTSHNVWQQSWDQNLSNTIQQTEYFKEHLDQVPMYPIFGNHESFPVNIYEFFGEREIQFNKDFGDLWEFWIGQESADMLREQGFYEKTLKEYGNLKVIALNTQACDELNMSLSENPTDPAQMLQKLRKSLYESEKIDQPVYIISHVPINGGCLQNWASVFAAIVDRFSYNIRGIFNAHTHKDEFGIFYNHSDSTKAVNANFIAPSLTTFSNLNPSFRVFEADRETMQIVNIHQYRLDISYWNQFTDPNTELLFEKAYDFVSEYNLSNMWDYSNLSSLRDQIGKDDKTFEKYMDNYYSGEYKLRKDQQTEEQVKQNQKEQFCRILATNKEYEECLNGTYKPSIFETLSGSWFQKIEKNNATQKTILE